MTGQSLYVEAKTISDARTKVDALLTLGAITIVMEAYGHWEDAKDGLTIFARGERIDKLGYKHATIKVSIAHDKDGVPIISALKAFPRNYQDEDGRSNGYITITANFGKGS